jgi:hypothetical protein
MLRRFPLRFDRPCSKISLTLHLAPSQRVRCFSASSKSNVVRSLMANALICGAKGTAFAASGSGAMLSEGLFFFSVFCFSFSPSSF